MINLFEHSRGSSGSPTSSRVRKASNTETKVDDNDGKRAEGGGQRNNHIDTKTSNRLRRPQEEPNKLHDAIPTTPPISPLTHAGYQIEAYSLTLLKHKSYFNNRPLARCLDGYQEEEGNKKTQQVLEEEEHGREQGVGGKGSVKQGRQEEQSSKQDEYSSPIRRLDGLMSELLVWQDIPGDTIPESHPRGEVRDPADVDGFWRRVRAHLWIDEDEIERRRRESMAILQDDIMVKDRAEAPWSQDTDTDPEPLPPPAPSRPPPPVPMACREPDFLTNSSRLSQFSIASSLQLFQDPDLDYPAWDQAPRTPSVRLSILNPDFLDIEGLLPETLCKPELSGTPFSPAKGKPSPVEQPADNNHARKPSSSSGIWVRPPTWRSPSFTSLSPGFPDTPATPIPPLPAPTPETHYRHHRRHCSSYWNNQAHSHRPSKTSSSTSTSVASVLTSSPSGARSRRTLTGSSATTRSTRAGSSSTDLSMTPITRQGGGGGGEVAHRRLTAEEKLSEIDAFLSP